MLLDKMNLARGEPSQRHDTSAVWRCKKPLLMRMLLESSHLDCWLLCQVGFDQSVEALLGAVVVDTQGEFLPPVRVEKGPFVAYERPQDVAYISNLAVLPATRRQGIGERLLAAAEKVRGVHGGCCLLAVHPPGSRLQS